jgi:hypothetical protein
MSYRPVLNQFAMQRVAVPIFKPIATLGVGDDEQRKFMKLEMVKQGVTARLKAPSEFQSNFSLANQEGKRKVKESDFPTEFYLGEAIGNF